MSAAGKAVDQIARHFHSETCFSDPARTSDGNQSHILPQHKFFGGSNFFFSSHKPRSLYRNIGRAGLALLNLFFRKAIAYSGKFPREVLRKRVALIGLFFQTPSRWPSTRVREHTDYAPQSVRLFPAEWLPSSPLPCFS